MINKIIIGGYEKVSFPEFRDNAVIAKIDTGADSGSFHCTNIVEANDEITFSPFDHPKVSIKTNNYKKDRVKSSNGAVEVRYFVTTTINIAGKVLPITLSLSDRSTMKYPVLLGRKFLHKNNFIVDVSLNNS